jgi:hypothetical protein
LVVRSGAILIESGLTENRSRYAAPLPAQNRGSCGQLPTVMRRIESQQTTIDQSCTNELASKAATNYQIHAT